MDALDNFQYTTADGDDLLVRDLVKHPKTLTAEQLAEIKRVALAEPTLNNRTVTERANVTGVNVTLQYPDDAPEAVSEVAAAAEQLRAEMRRQHPDVRLVSRICPR